MYNVKWVVVKDWNADTEKSYLIVINKEKKLFSSLKV